MLVQQAHYSTAVLWSQKMTYWHSPNAPTTCPANIPTASVYLQRWVTQGDQRNRRKNRHEHAITCLSGSCPGSAPWYPNHVVPTTWSQPRKEGRDDITARRSHHSLCDAPAGTTKHVGVDLCREHRLLVLIRRCNKGCIYRLPRAVHLSNVLPLTRI
jgi:hypothetical protein